MHRNVYHLMLLLVMSLIHLELRYRYYGALAMKHVGNFCLSSLSMENQPSLHRFSV